MLNRLLESRSARSRNNAGTITSTAVHIALILSALYLTNTSSLPAVVPDPNVQILWTRPQAILPSAEPRSRPAEGKPAAAAQRRLASVNPAISADLPPVELQLGVISAADFALFGPESETSRSASGGTPTEEKLAYEAYELDTPASALANGQLPAYPASLRAAGIEGQVVAQFVVDAHGNAIVTSISIVSSTNDLFAESVRVAIRRMRFVPGRLAGKAVAQTVQQLFVFKLSR